MPAGLEIIYNTAKNLALRSVCRPVPMPFTDEIHDILDDLKYAIRHKDKVWTNYGLSISAPQIGVDYRIFIVSKPENWKAKKYHKSFEYFINPNILELSEELEECWEGCLSIPGLEYLVKRPKTVKAEYWDLFGNRLEKTFKYTEAVIVQHELDHLDGILITDKAIGERPITKREPTVEYVKE